MNYSKIKKLHNALAKLRYKCKENCYECCTWFSFLEEEKKMMKKELMKQGYKQPPNWKGNNHCEYLTEKWKCSIYNARPVICRSFSDIKFLMRWPKGKVLTQSCTYWKQDRYVEADKDYMDYWETLLDRWLLNDNAENIIKWALPLWIDLPNNLK